MGARTIADATMTGQIKGGAVSSLLNPDEVRRVAAHREPAQTDRAAAFVARRWWHAAVALALEEVRAVERERDLTELVAPELLVRAADHAHVAASLPVDATVVMDRDGERRARTQALGAFERDVEPRRQRHRRAGVILDGVFGRR